jgi:hypothetical protein
MTLCVEGLSQTFTLPTVILDSMIFEVRKGRACDTVMHKQEVELQKLGAELLANGKAIILLTKESSELSGLLKNCEELGALAVKEFRLEKRKLLVKIRKLIRVVILEGGVIVVMIILLV